MKRTEVIKNFLRAHTVEDLANQFSDEMECQVNVAQDNGEIIKKETDGRTWIGYTDGITTWKSFRIPWQAYGDADYEDSDIHWNFDAHVEAIGMTGWNWKKRQSLWVAYDFDALIGHSKAHNKRLTSDELQAIQDAVSNIDWVTVRKSTSGNGLHLYVYLKPVDSANHSEHAAIAKAVLAKMSAIAGYDFQSRVDTCGGNMWVWARKMHGTDGLAVLKQGTKLDKVPSNWRDYLQRVAGKTTYTSVIKDTDVGTYNEMLSKRTKVRLDATHRELIQYLDISNACWWWDQEHGILVTHTIHLKEAHHKLKLKGFYDTVSKGTNYGNDHNCFLIPLRGGAWIVRRYSPGTKEHDFWNQDGDSWTYIYYNREPTLEDVTRYSGGIEDPSGAYVFREVETLLSVLTYYGVNASVNRGFLGRQGKLKYKPGKFVVTFPYNEGDPKDGMQGWLVQGKTWARVFKRAIESHDTQEELDAHDETVRHLVASGEDAGWVIKTHDRWTIEPKMNVRDVLGSLGLKGKDITTILGNAIQNPWYIVNRPFKPEFPGGREWNMRSAQLKYAPSNDLANLHFPTWTRILEHCGGGLDYHVADNAWCKSVGILSGSEYLLMWIASLFQQPEAPLPYLFMYGGQNCGKSIFHEALSELLTQGYAKAETALKSSSNFNAELDGAVICVLEEIDLQRDRIAYNKIKDWVTSPKLQIHRKGLTPYMITNTTHWVHCANFPTYCPIFPGDTRITMVYVPELVELIPKRRMLQLLQKEAPDFISHLFNLELPETNDRLNLPAIETEEKEMAAESNKTPLEQFLDDNCAPYPGGLIPFHEFYKRFGAYVGTQDIGNWSKIRVGREIPRPYLKGRLRTDNSVNLANIKWKDDPSPGITTKWTLRQGYLQETR